MWGPVDGRGADTPVSLSSIQCFGAAMGSRCFLGPLAMAVLDRKRGLHIVLIHLTTNEVEQFFIYLRTIYFLTFCSFL